VEDSLPCRLTAIHTDIEACYGGTLFSYSLSANLNHPIGSQMISSAYIVFNISGSSE
jgi:hypothetical protein